MTFVRASAHPAKATFSRRPLLRLRLSFKTCLTIRLEGVQQDPKNPKSAPKILRAPVSCAEISASPTFALQSLRTFLLSVVTSPSSNLLHTVLSSTANLIYHLPNSYSHLIHLLVVIQHCTRHWGNSEHGFAFLPSVAHFAALKQTVRVPRWLR